MPDLNARQCLERAAAALQLERERCAEAEEELWAGYRRFARKCGGGEGSYMWVSCEHEVGWCRLTLSNPHRKRL
jgi:hypothetical protein